MADELKVLDRAAILTAEDQDRELVPVPEWGGRVWVHGLSAMQRGRVEDARYVREGRKVRFTQEREMVEVCRLAMRDEKGGLLFPAAPDVAALGQKSARAMDRVYRVALRLSGMREEDLEEAAGN